MQAPRSSRIVSAMARCIVSMARRGRTNHTVRMVKIGLIALLLSTLVAAPASAAKIHVSPSDVAATRSYLRAIHQLSQDTDRHAAASEASVHALIAHVQGRCPNVMVGAPETKAVAELAFQSITQIARASDEPVHRAEIAFAKTVKRLRWSNRKLDYYIHGSAEETRANAEIVMPEMCSEAQAIVAGGYQTVPESVARFERQQNAANSKVTIVIRPHEKEPSGLQQRILQMLKRGKPGASPTDSSAEGRGAEVLLRPGRRADSRPRISRTMITLERSPCLRPTPRHRLLKGEHSCPHGQPHR
jgi:hypothetical protein